MANEAEKAEKESEQGRNLANDEHDEGAMREAERRMLLHDEPDSDRHDAEIRDATSSGAGGEHDEAALEEASERMLLRRDR
jgi:hypothetical protein